MNVEQQAQPHKQVINEARMVAGALYHLVPAAAWRETKAAGKPYFPATYDTVRIAEVFLKYFCVEINGILFDIYVFKSP